MNAKKEIGGIFGGYLTFVYVLGTAIATFFVFILTGKNYNKFGDQRNTNLTIGWLVLGGIATGIFSFFYKDIELLGAALASAGILGVLTLFSELISRSIIEKEEQEEREEREANKKK